MNNQSFFYSVESHHLFAKYCIVRVNIRNVSYSFEWIFVACRIRSSEFRNVSYTETNLKEFAIKKTLIKIKNKTTQSKKQKYCPKHGKC